MKAINDDIISESELLTALNVQSLLDNEALISILETIEEVKVFDEFVIESTPPMGVFEIGENYYSVNLSTATINILGSLIDLYITLGIFTVAGNILGLTKSGIYKIKSETGELCNYIYLSSLDKSTVDWATVFSYYSERTCPYTSTSCVHKLGDRCTIDKKSIKLNVIHLVEIGALNKSSERMIYVK